MTHRRFLAAPILAAALVLASCAGDAPQRSRPVPPPPTGAVPTDVLPFVSFGEDTNSNGYRDTFVLTLLLFSRTYADASIYCDGSLDLTLVGKSGKTIHTWKLPADVVAGLAKKMPAGPSYFIKLSLLDGGGSDKLDEPAADLRIVFTPVNAPPISATATGVGLGRIAR